MTQQLNSNRIAQDYMIRVLSGCVGKIEERRKFAGTDLFG